MIYVLTIEGSSRRRLLDQLNNLGLEHKVVYGINGRTQQIPNKGLLKNTVKACALGHLKCIRQFYDSGEPNCFIFEDDFDLKPKDVYFLIGETKNYLSRKYDLVQLTSIDNLEIGRFSYMGIDFVKYKKLFGLSAYLLSREGANKILTNIRDPMYHIDYLIGNYVEFISIDNRFSQKIETKSLAQSSSGTEGLLRNDDLSFILNMSCCNYISLLTVVLLGILLVSFVNRIPLLMLFAGSITCRLVI